MRNFVQEEVNHLTQNANTEDKEEEEIGTILAAETLDQTLPPENFIENESEEVVEVPETMEIEDEQTGKATGTNLLEESRRDPNSKIIYCCTGFSREYFAELVGERKTGLPVLEAVF